MLTLIYIYKRRKLYINNRLAIRQSDIKSDSPLQYKLI